MFPDVAVATGATVGFVADAFGSHYYRDHYQFKVCYQNGGSLVPTVSPAPSLLPTEQSTHIYDDDDDSGSDLGTGLAVILYLAILGHILLCLLWICVPLCGYCCVGRCAPKQDAAVRGGCCDKADGNQGQIVRFYAITGVSFYTSTMIILLICYFWLWILVQVVYSRSDELEEFCLDHTDDDGDGVSSDVTDFCKNLVDSIEYFYWALVVAGLAQFVYIVAYSRLCCCCGAITKNGFRLTSFVIVVAIAGSITAAIFMVSAYTNFTQALDQFVDAENDFWDVVADIFLYMTIILLLPAMYAVPIELLVCRATFNDQSKVLSRNSTNSTQVWPQAIPQRVILVNAAMPSAVAAAECDAAAAATMAGTQAAQVFEPESHF